MCTSSSRGSSRRSEAACGASSGGCLAGRFMVAQSARLGRKCRPQDLLPCCACLAHRCGGTLPVAQSFERIKSPLHTYVRMSPCKHISSQTTNPGFHQQRPPAARGSLRLAAHGCHVGAMPVVGFERLPGAPRLHRFLAIGDDAAPHAVGENWRRKLGARTGRACEIQTQLCQLGSFFLGLHCAGLPHPGLPAARPPQPSHCSTAPQWRLIPRCAGAWPPCGWLHNPGLLHSHWLGVLPGCMLESPDPTPSRARTHACARAHTHTHTHTVCA